MTQGRSTKIISMIKWIRTSRLSIQNSLSAALGQWSRMLIQDLLEHKVHHAVGAYTRPVPASPGPPYERCGT